MDPGFAMYPVAVYASVVQALPLVPHQKLAFFIGTLAVFFFSNSMGAQIAICEALTCRSDATKAKMTVSNC